MFFIYKNKGILVPLYLGVSVIAITTLYQFLKSWLTAELHMLVVFGIGTMVAGIWSYVTRDSYYISNGRKKPMNEENSFFFISMKIWGYLMLATGFVIMIVGIFTMKGAGSRSLTSLMHKCWGVVTCADSFVANS